MQNYIQTMHSHHEFDVLQVKPNHQYINHKNRIEQLILFLLAAVEFFFYFGAPHGAAA